MPENRILALLARAVQPPFRGLAWLLWGFFVWAYMIHPESAFKTGAFIDPDDIMHLMRAMDWLKGQGWYDDHLLRFGSAQGVPFHFSRLAELPLAAIMGAAQALGMGWEGAARLASALWPPVLLIFFFMALRWAAEPLVEKRYARASAYVAFFITPVMMQFAPSRVDHHGLAEIVTLLALGSVLRLMRAPETLLWPLLGGFFLALGQTIALETLPWLLILSGWVGFWTLLKGRGMAVPSLVFGLSLYLSSALFLAATKAPAAFYTLDPLVYSYFYVLLAGGLALALGFVGLAAFHGQIWPRLVAALVSVGGLGTALLFFNPALKTGPLGAMDPAFQAFALSKIIENIPLLYKSSDLFEDLVALAYPLFALYLCLRRFERRDATLQETGAWALLFLLILSGSFLAATYLARIVCYADLFSILPLTAFLPEALAAAREKFRGRRQAAAEFAVLLLVGPLLGLFLPATLDGRPFNKGVLLFPAVMTVAPACPFVGVGAYLSLPQTFGDRPRIIMNMFDAPGEILLHTPHIALAGLYHTNVEGSLASIRFFGARTDEAAEKILRATGAELVLLCRPKAGVYSQTSRADFERVGDERPEKKDEVLAQRLVAGKTPPWLEKIENPLFGDYLLYKVVKP